MKTKYTCPHCGSDNIEAQAWVKLNDPTQYDLIDPSEVEFYFCGDCGKRGLPIEQPCDDTCSVYILSGRDAIQAVDGGNIDGFPWESDTSIWDITTRTFYTAAEALAYSTALNDFYDVNDNFYMLTQQQAEKIWTLTK